MAGDLLPFVRVLPEAAVLQARPSRHAKIEM
jgi:hypothetical protein